MIITSMFFFFSFFLFFGTILILSINFAPRYLVDLLICCCCCCCCLVWIFRTSLSALGYRNRQECRVDLWLSVVVWNQPTNLLCPTNFKSDGKDQRGGGLSFFFLSFSVNTTTHRTRRIMVTRPINHHRHTDRRKRRRRRNPSTAQARSPCRGYACVRQHQQQTHLNSIVLARRPKTLSRY